MSLLTQRALRVYAVLESYRDGSRDILDALLPFFEPILMEFAGKILDQNLFAEKVRQAYRWSFTADIVEELIPRFQQRHWVRQIQPRTKEPTYEVTYNNPAAAPLGPNEAHIGQVLSRVSLEFKEFIETISPLTAINKSPDELSDKLVEWLISIDAYSEDVLRQQLIQISDHDGKIGVLSTLPDSSGLSSEERYLCARFVKQLNKEHSPYIQDLCKLASVGLLTEVIQDFQKPLSSVKRTNLVLYLDAPVALDLIGTSGTLAAENIRPIISKMIEIGATVRIFRQSVNELQHALDAVLKRQPSDRVGLTATAMRRGEVLESLVRQVVADPDTILKAHNVAVVERRLDQFPGEHDFFTSEHYEAMFSKMNWHVNDVARREHDSTVAAFIIRMRGRTHSPDLFETRHLLITRNGPFAQLAKHYCSSQGLVPKHAVSPVIHQRQLATAVWLRTGLQGSIQEIPRRYVLAACERVLELKKNIVDQVKYTARSLTPQKAEQLELLLTQDRSIQLLMDKTLGVSNVISTSNIDLLVEDMKKSLTQEIEMDAQNRISTAEKEARSSVKKATDARKVAEKQSSKLSEELELRRQEDQAAVEYLISNVNTALRKRRRRLKWGIAIFVLVLSLLPVISETLSGWIKIASLLAGGVFSGIFAFLQIFDRPVGLDRSLEHWGRKKLNSIADISGLRPKLNRFIVVFRDNQLCIADNETKQLSV